jgi:hypothetical protein
MKNLVTTTNMKTLSALALFLLCCFSAFAQNCNSCTQTISTSQTGALTINPGDIVCITSTGDFTGTVHLYGGILCNDGIIEGDILQTGGQFNNYGTHSVGDFNMPKGGYHNEGTVDLTNFSATGDLIVFENFGSFHATNFSMSEDQGAILLEGENNGEMTVTNFSCEGCSFVNNDSMEMAGSFQATSDASFENYGPLHITGSWQNNESYFYTECTVIIDGSWTNDELGEVEGPMSGCGGFSVAGSASNLGNIAMDSSYIDVCQTGGGAMLSVGNAAEGINFTQCVCSTSCSGTSSVGILREHVQDFDVLLYPNPANNVLTISVENGVGQRVAFTIFDHSGRAVRSGDFAGESHQIGVSELAAGLYMMNLQQADGRQMSSRFVVR